MVGVPADKALRKPEAEPMEAKAGALLDHVPPESAVAYVVVEPMQRPLTPIIG